MNFQFESFETFENVLIFLGLHFNVYTVFTSFSGLNEKSKQSQSPCSLVRSEAIRTSPAKIDKKKKACTPDGKKTNATTVPPATVSPATVKPPEKRQINLKFSRPTRNTTSRPPRLPVSSAKPVTARPLSTHRPSRSPARVAIPQITRPKNQPQSPAKPSQIEFPVLSNTPFKKKNPLPKAHKKDYLNINGYLFVEKLDSGGFGTVYKAEKNGEIVAVKVVKLDPNEEHLDSDLKRELAVLSQVEHEHIVHCYDIMRTAHRVYIFMEYASGGTLGKYVRKYGPLPVSFDLRSTVNRQC